MFNVGVQSPLEYITGWSKKTCSLYECEQDATKQWEQAAMTYHSHVHA